MDLQAILLLMAVVMAMGAVAAAIGRFVVRAEPSALVPLALAAGCAVSFIQQDGWPALAKSGGVLALSPMWASIVVVAAALSLVALADGLLPRRWIAIRGRRWRVAIAAAGVVGAFLRLPAVEWIGLSYVAAIATAVLVIATDELVSRQRGVAWIATLSIAFVATGALFVQSGFAKGGVIAGALGATLLAVALVSWCTRVGLGSIASACVLALLASFTALGPTRWHRASAPSTPSSRPS